MKQQITGLEQLDKALAKLPIDLREKYLRRSINNAVRRVVEAAAPRVPQPGKTTGGIEYTERKGRRRARPMLHMELGKVLRSYQRGEVLAGVGGPLKRGASRHAHLIERGFNHTTGGTFAGSGGKTRKSRRGANFTGKGVRRAFIFPRPFLLYTWERMRNSIESELIADITRGVEKLARAK